ncbi:MAG TPA: DUF2851 family protein [Bacteroidia bacterium]|nr:DUF2851 family protein [Bacteroidia bacterium]
MPEISEDLLQFIWEHKLLLPAPLFTVSGKSLSILNSGSRNPDSGPDFFNASILFEGVRLAGNIELHVKSSDWLRHGHQNDKAYEKIILHVVFEHDQIIRQNEENHVEVLELKRYISPSVLKNYTSGLEFRLNLPCRKLLPGLRSEVFRAWLDRLSAERLEEKVGKLEDLFQSADQHFTQCFYILLLRSFGMSVNALPFEMLARQLPLRILLRHANEPLQLEALLMGCSGMLEEVYEEDHPRRLQNEFAFLSSKYGLIRLEKGLFKYSRMRPSNFPDLRLAQFAALLHARPDFIQAPLKLKSADEFIDMFEVHPGTYWTSHYRLGLKSKHVKAEPGRQLAESILINSLVPFYFFYAGKKSEPRYRELALAFLASCAFEQNRKTALFSGQQSVLKSAIQSQACIRLYDEYCSKKRCFNCEAGRHMLKGQ